MVDRFFVWFDRSLAIRFSVDRFSVEKFSFDRFIC